MKECFSSKRTQCRKAEGELEASKAREAALEAELEELHKELKSKGKCKASPEPQQPQMTCKFHEWESASDSHVTKETSISRSSRK